MGTTSAAFQTVNLAGKNTGKVPEAMRRIKVVQANEL